MEKYIISVFKMLRLPFHNINIQSMLTNIIDTPPHESTISNIFAVF